MAKGQLADYLVKRARDYVNQSGGVSESLRRNEHMHDVHPVGVIDADVARAIVTDYVNFVMHCESIDLGLYARDIKQDAAGVKP